MICCSIQNKSFREIEQLLKTVEMAEIRLDLCDLDDEQIEKLFISDTPLIATCRASDGDFHRTERLLTLAIKAGARYADLEIEAPKPVSKRIAQACAEWGTTLIRSYHNFECTPSLDELRSIVDRCRHHDGQVVKIVTTALSAEDAAVVESLYNYYTAESLVAFAMGAEGRESRLDCLRKGAPFSYAAVSETEATASGQFTYGQMWEKVYGSRKLLNFGKIRVPASKSFAQRAIVAAAIADGTSVLKGYTSCGDSDAALLLAKSLGATVVKKRGAAGTSTLEITGIAAAPGCIGAEGVSSVHVGESGLLTRLMVPLCCELFADGAVIEGTGTLLNRPLQGIKAAVRALGGNVEAALCDGDGNAVCDGHICGGTLAPNAVEADDALTVPLKVTGPLKGGRAELDGSKSSQLVSGALMALPLCARNSTLSVQNPTSIPYIYMTMDLLRKFGVKVRSEMYGGHQLLDRDWDKCTDILLKIKENQRYKAAVLDIEGDWSAASVFLAAGAVFGEVALEGLDTSSIQADLTMLDLLMDAGASLSQLDEPTGTIVARKSPLQAIRADLSNSPDLFPVLSVFCAFCQGRSQLRGVHRLLHKESNRADGILAMLTRLGVPAQIKDDDLFVSGESLDSRIMNARLLRGGAYTSSHDHRMVMALRLAELGADSPIGIDDTACVAKSFPGFNELWETVSGPVLK